MDYFGYIPNENVRQVLADRWNQDVADGYFDERRQLREVRLELARRRARRHPIRQADLDAVV